MRVNIGSGGNADFGLTMYEGRLPAGRQVLGEAALEVLVYRNRLTRNYLWEIKYLDIVIL